MKTKEYFMKQALAQAKKALENNEVPIGAVIEKDGEIISRAFNKKEKCFDATAHAEILAIKKACKKLGDWRLDGCTLYVTLEPCVMCSGAIVGARIDKVVCGAKDNSGNLCGEQIFENNFTNHKTEFESGILKKECESIIKEFFVNKRIKTKK